MTQEFWQRYIEVQIGTQIFTNEDFDIEFTIENSTDQDAGDAEIALWNLSDATRQAVTKGTGIQVKAGYENNYGIIFLGTVDTVKDEDEGADNRTVITALDAHIDLFNAGKVRVTYPTGTRIETIVGAMFTAAGVPSGQVETTGVTLEKPTLFYGTPYDNIRYCENIVNGIVMKNCPYTHQQIAEATGATKAELIRARQQYVNEQCFTHHIKHNTGYFVRGRYKEDTTLAIVVSSATGLMSVLQNEDKESTTDYTVKTLLNWQIEQDSLIDLRSEKITGVFKVISFKHVAAVEEYFTEAEVKGL